MESVKSPRKPKKKIPTESGPDRDEALRQSKASYRGLFNTIRQAIYIQDQEGRFVEVNDGACAMYGYTREEITIDPGKGLLSTQLLVAQDQGNIRVQYVW